MLNKDITINFAHQQSAHCETGVLSGLLSYHGLNISEALCFGIGSGLFFGYFPFIRVHGLSPHHIQKFAWGHLQKGNTTSWYYREEQKVR